MDWAVFQVFLLFTGTSSHGCLLTIGETDLDAPEISIVVPLYNETSVFQLLVERLNKVMDEAEFKIEVVLVDDGSRDDTALKMANVAMQDPRYQSVFLSRNYGHQLALSAGLSAASGTKAVMVIDGDLQDPPELLFGFYDKLNEGFDVVYAVRKKRKEGFVKKLAYNFFYRIQRRMANIEVPLDSGDFSLMSRRVVDILNTMGEESRFIRGMRSWIGFKQVGVEYERDARAAGETKYGLKELTSLAYNGIFNFSEIPIKFITNLGIVTMVLALPYAIYTLIKRFVFGDVGEGFTAILMVIIMFSAVQLISLGVIGEYVLRIFFQVKGRPLFVVKNRIKNKEIIDG